MKPRNRRRLRWVVPAATLALTAGAASVSHLLPAGAASSPVLPPLTPAQLLEKVRNASVTTLSGDIRLSSHLGLPDLGSLGIRGGTLLDLLTGTHTAHVWVDGPERVRVALDAPQAESDWIRNGSDLWSWDSSSQHVIHATLNGSTDTSHSAGGGADAGRPVLDPASAADRLLTNIDPTTTVTVDTPGYVAGRPVYELVVAPRSDKSTIADGVISVDAATGIPLAVRIDARGQTTPAVQVVFTSVSFDKPAASTFAFTPPPGSTIDETTDPTSLLPLGRAGHRERRGPPVRVPAPAPSGSPTAPARGTAGSAASTPRSNVTTLGTAWETVAIISGLDVGQFETLFADSPTVSVGSHTAHLVSTSLVNVLILDDGRIAVAAMTPDALTAAVAGR